MNKVNGKRMIGVSLSLVTLAATMLFTSCASQLPVTVTFVTLGGSGALPNVTVGHAYTTTIQADGTSGPPTGVYTYTIDSGTLPLGMTPTTVNTIGVNDTSVLVITGTDHAAGDSGKTFSFTVKAVDTETPAHSGI